MYLCKIFYLKQIYKHMNTYRDIVYYILDQVKLSSDDAYFEDTHVIYLLSKLRAYLLKRKYESVKNQISQSNFQTITVELAPYTVDPYSDCTDARMLRSTQPVPNLLLVNNYEGFSTAMHTYSKLGRFTVVSSARFDSVLYDKWLKNFIYVTIGTDNYLYVKSMNPQIYGLETIQLNSVFEDIEEASRLEEVNTNNCELLDMRFPLEEGLIIPLQDLALQNLLGALARPKDTLNNASDDMSDIHLYLNQILRKRAEGRTNIATE